LLGHGSIISIVALTRNHLTAANRTPLNITAKDVKLSLENSAIVARLPVCSPIVCLLTVAQTLTLDACNLNGRLQLCRLNLLGPALYHPSAVVGDEFLAHGVRVDLTSISPHECGNRSGILGAWLSDNRAVSAAIH